MTGIVVDGDRPAVEWVTTLPRGWRVTPAERLVLMCLACDAYKWESAPGYDLIADWTGMQRTSCIEVLARLCEKTAHRPALIERISVGGRRRTVWRLLGDTQPVDGVDQFTDAPRRRPPERNRSAAPTGSGAPTVGEPVGGTDQFTDGSDDANRSAAPTDNGPNRRPTVGEPSANRSAPPTAPFSLLPNPKTQRPSPVAVATGAAPGDDVPQTELELGVVVPERERSPVQILVAAYADRVRGTASSSILGAIGRNAKRLIEKDGIDPALVLAAIEEAAPRGSRDLDRFLAAPGGVSARYDQPQHRAAMRAHWAARAAELDARRNAS